MKVLSLNFTKINAQKEFDRKFGPITTNIEFIDITKDKLELLKDLEVLRASFKFSFTYKESTEKEAKNSAEIFFEGLILLSVDKEEAKEILKSWKKKEISQNTKLILSNILLRRCSIRALELEEELGIPFHIQLPRIQAPKN